MPPKRAASWPPRKPNAKRSFSTWQGPDFAGACPDAPEAGSGPAGLQPSASLHSQLVILTSPRDAIVLSVSKFSMGSVVTSAETLIQPVPLDLPLSIEADVSGMASRLHPGGADQVTIKFAYAALPPTNRSARGARCA